MIRLKDLLLEKNYNYQIPKDKENLMYDFYMISFLKTLNFDKVGDQRDSGDNVVSVGMVRGVSDSTKVSFEAAKNKLIPNLKKHLLNSVFFAVCAEFRHIFDNNSNKRLLEFFSNSNNKNFIKKYALYYNAFISNKGEFLDLDKLKLRRYSDSRGYQGGYQDSYKAVKNSGISDHEFITIAKEAFTKLVWAEAYGGKPWANICEGWLKLNDARQEDMVFVWIDHVYDLQHNTNTVFNKIQSYYKDGGYYWIKRALDHKAKISNPLEIIDKVSGTLRSMALEILKGVGYGDYEQFVKKAHIPPTVVSNSSSTSTNKNISWTWEDGYWKNGTWKDGTWEDGIWEDGTWKDGTWKDGIWIGGTWKEGVWQNGTWKNGTWNFGSWRDGTWKGGVWEDGMWYDGTWENGTWDFGNWFDGTWKGGTWKGGTWEDGIWEYGTWKDGRWKGGTWMGGIWKEGVWQNGTWEDGTWMGGSWEGGKWQGGWIYDPKKKGNFEEDWEWIGHYVRTPKGYTPDDYFALKI